MVDVILRYSCVLSMPEKSIAKGASGGCQLKCILFHDQIG